MALKFPLDLSLFIYHYAKPYPDQNGIFYGLYLSTLQKPHIVMKADGSSLEQGLVLT